MATQQITADHKLRADVVELVRQLMERPQFASVDDLLLAALLNWREELAGEDDDWPAIKIAVDELQEGVPCKSVDQAFAELRERHRLPIS